MSKNTILIDASGAKTIGSLNNIKSLYNYININEDNNLYIFIVSSIFLNPKTSNNKNIKILHYNFLKILPIRIIWSSIILPFYGLLNNVKLIYSPFDIGPFFKFNQKLILAIRNPNFILPKKLQTLKFPIFHKIISYLSSINTNVILYPSLYANKTISNHLYCKQSDVIYHGIDLDLWRMQNVNYLSINEVIEKDKYILFCSPFYKFKNLETLLLAYSIYNKESVEKLTLILIGKFVSSEYETKIKKLIFDLEIKHKTKILSNVSINDLIYLYRNAKVITITSLYETFGHMYVEGLLSNKPVISCNTEIANEIMSNFPTYFEPENYIELSKILINKIYLSKHEEQNNELSNWLNKYSLYNENFQTINLFNKITNT